MGTDTNDLPQNNIIFMNHGTEVLRISKAGIEVPHGVNVSEAAAGVIAAVDKYVVGMVQREVQKEREACAEACNGAVGSASMYDSPDSAKFAYGIKNHCQELIRARGNDAA